MDKELIIKRLKEALENSQRIQLMFIFPDTRPIFKRGYVKAISNNTFNFNDRFDGLVTLTTEFLVEIKNLNENGNRSTR